MNKKAFSADIKNLARDPILLIFMMVPFLAVFAIKLMIVYGAPLLKTYTGFIITPYYPYVEAFCLLLAPGMLGAVSAFMMIDERDAGICELMSVTPIGFRGYVTNRLLLPFMLSMVYTAIMHIVLRLNVIHGPYFFTIMLFAGMQSTISALFLFALAKDKVQGLTLAKAMNLFILSSAGDLTGLPIVIAVCSAVPFYWTARVMTTPSMLHAVIGFAVNGVWTGAAIIFTIRKH